MGWAVVRTTTRRTAGRFAAVRAAGFAAGVAAAGLAGGCGAGFAEDICFPTTGFITGLIGGIAFADFVVNAGLGLGFATGLLNEARFDGLCFDLATGLEGGFFTIRFAANFFAVGLAGGDFFLADGFMGDWIVRA